MGKGGWENLVLFWCPDAAGATDWESPVGGLLAPLGGLPAPLGGFPAPLGGFPAPLGGFFPKLDGLADGRLERTDIRSMSLLLWPLFFPGLLCEGEVLRCDLDGLNLVRVLRPTILPAPVPPARVEGGVSLAIGAGATTLVDEAESDFAVDPGGA